MSPTRPASRRRLAALPLALVLVSAVTGARAGDLIFRSGFDAPATCGNAVIEELETCDDGDSLDGDGCSASCMVESGFVCSGSPSACVSDCAAITLAPEIGFTPANTPDTWAELTGAPSFPDMDLESDLRKVPYKPGLAFLGASRGHYVAIPITTPGTYHSGDLSFNSSQIVGTNAARDGQYFISLTRCPGDFRVQVASPQDSTEYGACRNIRLDANGKPKVLQALRYDLSGVGGDGFINTACGLLPNHTYYLNYINAEVLDGVSPNEHACPDDVNSCGVQFKAN